MNEQGEHLHTLHGRPLMGTSTVTGVISKPLTWWASGLAVAEFGWIKKLDTRKSSKSEVEKNAIDRLESSKHALETLKTLKPEEYLKKLDDAYRAHSVRLDKSATQGTDMHELLENYVKAHIAGLLESVDYSDQRVKLFHEWTSKNVKRFLWSEGACYSEKMWVGGISDVGAELLDGSYIIIDFKSSKEAYDSQFIQCAGYKKLAEENGVYKLDGELILKLDKPISQLIIFPFGAEKVEPQIRYDVDELAVAFEACVVLYKITNKK